MIFISQLLDDPKFHYDNMVEVANGTKRTLADATLGKTQRFVKRAAFLNTVPMSLGTITESHMKDTRVICLSAAVGAMYSSTVEDTINVPLFSKGVLNCDSFEGAPEYYMLDSDEFEKQAHLIISELYDIAIVQHPALELEYIMMNRTPSDLGIIIW